MTRKPSAGSPTAWAWLAAVLVVLQAWSPRAAAQADACAEQLRGCQMTCLAPGAPAPGGRDSCLKQCTGKNAECRLALRNPRIAQRLANEAASAPAAATPTTTALAPELKAPLDSSDISSAIARAQAALRGTVPSPSPAPGSRDCTRDLQGHPNARSCWVAQMREAQDGDNGRTARALTQLWPVEQSLKLDLAALPADPVEALRALRALERSYGTAVAWFQQIDGAAPRNSPDPVAQLARRFEQTRLLRQIDLQNDPSVYSAYLEGRVQDDELLLSASKRNVWQFERDGSRLLASLRQQFSGTVLFADRKTDIQQSSRERQWLASGVPGPRWGEPSETEMGLALLRVYASVNGQIESAYEAERRLPSGKAADRGLALVDNLRLYHVQKTGPCRPVAGAWSCSFRAWSQIYLTVAGARLETQPGGSLHPAVERASKGAREAMRRNGEPAEVRFSPTAGGWSAPDLVAAMQSVDVAITEFADARARAKAFADCEANFRAKGLWNWLHTCSY